MNIKGNKSNLINAVALDRSLNSLNTSFHKAEIAGLFEQDRYKALFDRVAVAIGYIQEFDDQIDEINEFISSLFAAIKPSEYTKLKKVGVAEIERRCGLPSMYVQSRVRIGNLPKEIKEEIFECAKEVAADKKAKRAYNRRHLRNSK